MLTIGIKFNSYKLVNQLLGFRFLHEIILFYVLVFSSFQSISADIASASLSRVLQGVEILERKDILSAIKLIQYHDQQVNQYPIEEQIQFRKIQAELFNKKTDFTYAKKSIEIGIALTKQLSRPSVIMAELLNIRGFSLENMGDYDSALNDYMAALEISESLNNQRSVIKSLTHIGAIYYITGELKRSLIILNDALLLTQKLDDEELLGIVESKVGILYRYLEQGVKAKQYHESAYKHLINANRAYLALESLENIAINHVLNKRYNDAISLFKDVIVKAKEYNNYTIITNSYILMAKAYLKKNHADPHTAYHYIQIAEKYLKSVESAHVKMFFLINKARVLHHLKKYDEALETIAFAEELMPEQPFFIKTYALPNIFNIKSEVFYAQQLYKEAYSTQKKYYENRLVIENNNNLKIIDSLRVEYESKQHEVVANVLENKKKIQLQELQQVSNKQEERHFYIIIGLFCVVGLACFYIVNLKNQKRLLKSRETDHLTELPNRKTLLPKGTIEFNKASSNNKHYSVLLIQVDNFRNINQVKGYSIGNNILIEISNILLNSIAKYSHCGKYSSNEFIILLPEYNAEQAKNVADKINNDIYVKSWDKYGLKVVSVSIGIAMNNNDLHSMDSFEDIIKKASTLKEQAIEEGGNTICV